MEEHACLNFSDFLSTLLAIFHVINKKNPPCSFINLLCKKKQAGSAVVVAVAVARALISSAPNAIVFL